MELELVQVLFRPYKLTKKCRICDNWGLIFFFLSTFYYLSIILCINRYFAVLLRSKLLKTAN